jgi:hypothetical protein
VGNPDSHSERDFNGRTKVIAPDPFQELLRRVKIDLAAAPRHPVLPSIQHMQENDFTVEWFSERISNRENLRWTLRQINRQQQPIGFYAETVKR